MSDYWKMERTLEKLRGKNEISGEGSVMRLEPTANKMSLGLLRNLAWRRQRRSVWGIRVVKRLGFCGGRIQVPIPPLPFTGHVDSVRTQ